MSLASLFKERVESPSLAIRTLRGHGYDYITDFTNTFASCLHRPMDQEVVIVNLDPYCAPRFYELCKQGVNNPFLPKVHETQALKGGTIARMERLVALDHPDIQQEDKELLELAAPALTRYICGKCDDGEKTAIESAYPKVREAAVQILKLSQQSHATGNVLFGLDENDTNIFLRRKPDGNHEFVFGDPLKPETKGRMNMPIAQKIYDSFGLSRMPQQVVALELDAVK